MDYYGRIILDAKTRGYVFMTLSEFIKADCPDRGCFIIRHDVDRQPLALAPIVKLEHELGVRSTTFVRIAGADYNLLSYPTFKVISDAVLMGTEIGLHSNFVEFGTINNIDPARILAAELNLLRGFFVVDGIAPHRDINYMYNSLPYLDEKWSELSQTLQLKYHSYEQRILSNVTYVNEGFDPHLCWRSVTPEQAIVTGRSIYMLTHPHWWFRDHAFETP